MKYKLLVTSEEISLVDNCGRWLVHIYWACAVGAKEPKWPDGFWYCPDWRINSVSENRNANIDYHENREEYIAEAKKFLVKEML